MVRVKLTGADGKPVIGVQVSATFFMPAMPAMGMAAQRAVSHTLPTKATGIYEGSLQLDVRWHLAGDSVACSAAARPSRQSSSASNVTGGM